MTRIRKLLSNCGRSVRLPRVRLLRHFALKELAVRLVALRLSTKSIAVESSIASVLLELKVLLLCRMFQNILQLGWIVILRLLILIRTTSKSAILISTVVTFLTQVYITKLITSVIVDSVSSIGMNYNRECIRSNSFYISVPKSI